MRIGLLSLLALAACTPKPQPANPALWLIEGPRGERGWLFGTIHSLERPALWRSATVDRALRHSSLVVVEVGNLADDAALRRTFLALSQSPGLPPLSARVAPALRPKLAEVLRRVGANEGDFANVETWAVALSLALPLTDLALPVTTTLEVAVTREPPGWLLVAFITPPQVEQTKPETALPTAVASAKTLAPAPPVKEAVAPTSPPAEVVCWVHMLLDGPAFPTTTELPTP